MPTTTDVLISGAGVAGPTLAYWLHRYGFRPTVVERTPAERLGVGGHSVDLFGPAVEVAERMGLLPAVLAARTGTEVVSFERPGRSPIVVDLARMVAGISDRHVEIMRGELTSILLGATRDHVEYVAGDSIRALAQDGDGVQVTFEHGPPRTFALVVGADGLHSNVRRLTFGEESSFRQYIGGHLAIFTVPNYLGLRGRVLNYNTPGKVVGMYPLSDYRELRAGMLFRRDEPFGDDHRGVEQQKSLLRETFARDGWEVPRLLAELDDAADFYFDSISQIVMETWSDGRITLVGDAGYSPGPAVGGGTSVAMVGAYVLAGELHAAGGDHIRAFRGYEDRMRDFVRLARTIGPTTMKSLIPATASQVWLMPRLIRLVTRLPVPLQRRLSTLQGDPARALAAITVENYD
ncbi:FAD-dependent monooxygenase [Paractinoplanes toevensis]|uniref:FAD-dependent oxidoreductase n=1 Tax=Paractinoplanes toevensis TaxID=571911 RepID=A0A919WDV9_9ACTN|nr:FAD-dependent monooxygenase [Actinoplanes toevensis]GIM98303.1 FAD-dependent oxidoreductase [Actinoplanes toevensis]